MCTIQPKPSQNPTFPTDLLTTASARQPYDPWLITSLSPSPAASSPVIRPRGRLSRQRLRMCSLTDQLSAWEPTVSARRRRPPPPLASRDCFWATSPNGRLGTGRDGLCVIVGSGRARVPCVCGPVVSRLAMARYGVQHVLDRVKRFEVRCGRMCRQSHAHSYSTHARLRLGRCTTHTGC